VRIAKDSSRCIVICLLEISPNPKAVCVLKEREPGFRNSVRPFIRDPNLGHDAIFVSLLPSRLANVLRDTMREGREDAISIHFILLTVVAVHV
jgi:hypothetical protein